VWRKYQLCRPESRASDGCIKTVTATDAFLPIWGKAEQLQEEVLEIQLKSLLKSRFPQDEIEPLLKERTAETYCNVFADPLVKHAEQSSGELSAPSTGVKDGSQNSATTSAPRKLTCDTCKRGTASRR
jgi:hypothetical protein